MTSSKFRHLCRSLFVLCLLYAALPLGCTVYADERDVDSLVRKLAKTLSKAKIKTVVITDFADSDGMISPIGKFLADRVSEALAEEDKKRFSVLGRDLLPKMFPERKLTREVFQDKEILRSVGNEVRAVITGEIEGDSQTVTLRINVLDTAIGKELGQTAVKIPRSMLPDDLPTDGNAPPVYVVGKDNVSYPQCIYCPVPSYSDAARSAKFQGRVVLQAVITPEGRASQIIVIKMAGHGLDERAIEEVRTWKFKPATKDGEPVATRTPIEISFRLM